MNRIIVLLFALVLLAAIASVSAWGYRRWGYGWGRPRWGYGYGGWGGRRWGYGGGWGYGGWGYRGGYWG